MFGIGLPELAVIMIVGVIVFGPDRLPEYARQAGRFMRQVRNFAQTAQEDLRSELGPEFADLDIVGVDPRAAIREYMLGAIGSEDDDDILGELASRNEASASLDEAATDE